MDNKFTITINNEKYEFNKKVKILDLIKDNKYKYIYAKVNNRLRELTYEVFYDAEVTLLTKSDFDAYKVYERSLRFIVAYACSKLLPDIEIKFS